MGANCHPVNWSRDRTSRRMVPTHMRAQGGRGRTQTCCRSSFLQEREIQGAGRQNGAISTRLTQNEKLSKMEIWLQWLKKNCIYLHKDPKQIERKIDAQNGNEVFILPDKARGEK